MVGRLTPLRGEPSIWDADMADGYIVGFSRGNRLNQPLDIRFSQRPPRGRTHSPSHLEFASSLIFKARENREAVCTFLIWAIVNYTNVDAWGTESEQTDYSPPTEPDIPEFDSLGGWSLDHHCAYNDIISRNEKMGRRGNNTIDRYIRLLRRMQILICGNEDFGEDWNEIRKVLSSAASPF
jgi:hypothetical protein